MGDNLQGMRNIQCIPQMKCIYLLIEHDNREFYMRFTYTCARQKIAITHAFTHNPTAFTLQTLWFH